ncbi:MAG: SDR family oxidoreductase [Candidatus Nitrohelix vancouverensis]|uniref:SDR family oxidoreductase n=1 Tax=Candidatus Nitrohelix vancouverensis TaxID=2705534 RepID=A0A7T0G289_9BACT|nr:MAG: SDR family oxidoreductase [Candidatus Nitrohelix vancouverensis]
MNPLDLTDKLVLVTGASSGLGREIGQHLSRLGARTLLLARNEAGLKDTLAPLDASKNFAVPFDLNQTSAIQPLLKELAKQHGPLYGIVHSAGMQTVSPLQYAPLDEIQSMIQVHLTAALALCKAFASRKVRANSGSVIFISSSAGIVGGSGLSVYSGVKGALISLARSLAIEWAGDNIRVNAIAPGYIPTQAAQDARKTLSTEQLDALIAEHPLGAGAPRDVANAAAFLMAETGRWITGTTLVIDGGYSAH